MANERLNTKKIIDDIKEMVHNLGHEGKSVVANECISQQIELADGRQAQIKIIINADEREFEEVCP